MIQMMTGLIRHHPFLGSQILEIGPSMTMLSCLQKAQAHQGIMILSSSTHQGIMI